MKKSLFTLMLAVAATMNLSAQKLIDLEHHFYTQEVMDLFASRMAAGIPPYWDAEKGLFQQTEDAVIPLGLLENKIWDLNENRIKEMDEAGIDMAVLSISPGIEEISDEANIPALCTSINNEIAAFVRQYPTRFRAAMVLPVAQVEEAVKELERCAKMKEFVLWHTHSSYARNGHLDDDKYLPLLQKAAELGIPVYIHPNVGDVPRINEFGGAMATAGYGFSNDVMTTTLRMMCKGAFDDNPTLKVILGHFGEFYPYVLKRMTDHFQMQSGGANDPKQPIDYYFKHNIIVSSSGVFDPAVFDCCKAVIGSDRIVFGSDYPYESPKEAADYIKSLNFTDEAERTAVFEDNIKAFTGADFDNLVPTQVQSARVNTPENTNAYTVSGLPATESTKGIIIQNGYKTIK